MLDLAPFSAFNKQHALFRPEDKVLLAVSGGRDSVLMLHYFYRSGLTFGIAHCNFSLRGAEADEEEELVSGLARAMDVPFYSTRFETAAYAAEHHISIQMAARELRHQWLDEIRADFGYDSIALAHHRNDTVETILLNLTRGTGIAGMHGIRPKRGRIIRPLLFLDRREIDHIVHSENIPYRDDSSNKSSKYARNKIRLEVIPKLKELNPALEETFEANARRFAELELLLSLEIEKLNRKLFMPTASGEIKIPLAELQKLIPLNTLLYGLFSPYGFTEAVLADLQKSWKGQPGKIFHSATHQLLLDRDFLILSAPTAPNQAECLIYEKEGEFHWNNQSFKSRIVDAVDFKLNRSATVAQLDFDLLQFPLALRSWHRGDVFHPIGMKGKKKLSDYFIEQKVTRNQKKLVGILQNGNGDIAWIAGYRPDERYKVKSSTKKIFILEQYTSHGE